MSPEWWVELASDLHLALDHLSYGTGDYAIMSVALAVAYDQAGDDGAWHMQNRWNNDHAKVNRQRRLIES